MEGPTFSSMALLSISIRISISIRALHCSAFLHSLLFTSLRSPELSVPLFLLTLILQICTVLSSFFIAALVFSAWDRKKGRGCKDSRVSVSSVVMIHHHGALSLRAEAGPPLPPCLPSALVLPSSILVPLPLCLWL